MSTSQKTRIAIVGGGIGGLALAVALSHMSLTDFIEVDIYESASKLTQVGAGISFSPRGWEILKGFGLEASLAARLYSGKDLPEADLPKLAWSIRKSDQHEGALIKDFVIPGGSLLFHRADVQDVLLSHISSIFQLHLNHRLSTYRQTKTGVEIDFTNGESTTCDILIGADGIHSAVRRALLAEGKVMSKEEQAVQARPLWTGTVAYRKLIDSDILRKDSPNHPSLTTPLIQYCGKNARIITYPIQQGKLINTALFHTNLQKEGTYFDGQEVVQNIKNDFVPKFLHWEHDAQTIIKYMEDSSRWAIQTVKPLSTYVSGRVFLMGDAAHAMAPHLGQGAGQAIEDAYILSNILAKSLKQRNLDIQKISTAYDTIRQPFGNFVVEATRAQGLRYEFNSPGFEDLKMGDTVAADKLTELGQSIEKAWEWTCTSACGDLERALSML